MNNNTKPYIPYTLMFDGGSRGNPGISGCGFIIYSSIDENENNSQKIIEIASGSEYLGNNQTNNYAEYSGLIKGLEAALSVGLTNLKIEGDSILVIRQMLGEWKVKSPNIQPLYIKAKGLLSQLKTYSLKHIPRSKNARADALANEAMDKYYKFDTVNLSNV
jgi:ribonuclease HI/probable phosphoglycerate mutase